MIPRSGPHGPLPTMNRDRGTRALGQKCGPSRRRQLRTTPNTKVSYIAASGIRLYEDHRGLSVEDPPLHDRCSSSSARVNGSGLRHRVDLDQPPDTIWCHGTTGMTNASCPSVQPDPVGESRTSDSAESMRQIDYAPRPASRSSSKVAGRCSPPITRVSAP